MATVEAPNPFTDNAGALEAPADAEATKPEGEKEKKKAEPRDYKVMTKITGTPDKVKNELDKLGDSKLEVYVVHGASSALQPKLALQKWGQDHELNGTYHLAAANSFKDFKASTEPVTKTRVKIS